MAASDLKKAYFRFEASSKIGAGHAIRSTVLADALSSEGWKCITVTAAHSYKFISNLARFERVDPDDFYNNPPNCQLLVVDNYEIDELYEKHFRPYTNQILVIDDLANRKHDCDILLDQTFRRNETEYKYLVPDHCKLLTGSKYALLRPEFAQLRPLALEKRCKTTEVKRILVSMGGSDPNNFTLKALNLIKESGFTGAVDIVLGFQALDNSELKHFINTLPNNCEIHTNADMAQLMYHADLAIGAAGSSVWERCCIGLPSILMITADNQKYIYENLLNAELIYPIHCLLALLENIKKINITKISSVCDGKGVQYVQKLVG
jgi:UDP-2,4-diacetamido-2,4,6-trideoxy-beta-L-altropyranose hydrolase